MKPGLATLFIVFLLFFHATAYAQSKPPPVDPAHSLELTLDKISLFQKRHHYRGDTTLRTFIEHQIMPRFSFTALAQRVTGSYARHMSHDDMAAFRSRIKTDFFNMLIQHLGHFDPRHSPVQIEKTRYTQARLATVSIRVHLHQGIPLVLNFRMQLIHTQWKIIDIQSNGLSLAMYYRAHFSDQLQAYNHPL